MQGVKIEFRREGRTVTVEAWAPVGKTFSHGEHSLVETWPHGKKAEMIDSMRRQLENESLAVCDDENCDLCHPMEGDS